MSSLRQTLIYRKTIDHSSNCGNISRYICVVGFHLFSQILVSRTKRFGQKKNTVETYFTNYSLQRRDSFAGTQVKLDLITPKINIVSEFNLIDTDTRPMRTVDVDQ